MIWAEVSDRINKVYSDTLKIVFVIRPEIIDLPDTSETRRENKYASKTIYQSYFFSGTDAPSTINTKLFRLYLRNPGANVQFGFYAPWMPDSEEKDQLNKAFKISNRDQFYIIEHQAKTKKAGSYRFFITAYDRGIPSRAGVFTAKYYKALPFFLTLGSSRNIITKNRDASLRYFSLGITGYMKQRILLDFKTEIPMSDSADIQQVHNYPRNLRAGVIYELFPNLGSFFAGAELSFLYLYYPWNTRQFYFGYICLNIGRCIIVRK
jgi:hypothetical protein